MNILFVIDKLELKFFEFNELVTNFWLIKEFLDRGDEVSITTINNLYLENSIAHARGFKTFTTNGNIFYNPASINYRIDDFELVMFRPDPPVDNDYLSATYIMDFVKTAKIINNPRSIRNFNEKIHTALFPDLMPKYIVSANKSRIEDFLNECGEIVLKPVNQCFGAGVMYLHIGDPNTRSIINAVTNNESSLVMVQKYIPDIKFGDKRVLILGDNVLDECVLKLPTNDDFKFNTHDDNYIKRGSLSYSEKANFAEVAKCLNSLGIYMAGLDVVNEQIIEINITSPCYFIKEINHHFNTRLERKMVDYIKEYSIHFMKNEFQLPEMSLNKNVSEYLYTTKTV